MACKGSSNSVGNQTLRCNFCQSDAASSTQTARKLRRGSAIVLIVLVVVILSSLGVGLLRIGISSRIYATRAAQQVEARCAADAGLAKAVFAMNQKLKIKPWSDSGLPAEADQTLPNFEATFDYTVSVDGGNYTIASIGSSAEALKSVNSILRLKGLFEGAIVTRGYLTLKANTLIDGYNSKDAGDTDVDVKIATTSTLSDRIILNSGVTVDGEVFVGVDGNPSTVIRDLGATTGGRYSMTEEVVFPTIVPPTLADMGTAISVKGTTLTIGPAASGMYTGIDLSQMSEKIKGDTFVYPALLEVSGGDVVLHITGGIDIGESCEIIVRSDASLKLYVDGDIICRANSGMGNEGFPENLELYATGTGQQTLDIKAKSSWSGVLYAPNADVDLYAQGDIYGSFVAGDFEFKAGGDFHYDEALSQVTADDEGVRFIVKRWTEE